MTDTSADATTTAFCNDWLTSCSTYVKHLGGHPLMDCVRSQAGPVVKVFWYVPVYNDPGRS
jgi:hypothetical protein